MARVCVHKYLPGILTAAFALVAQVFISSPSVSAEDDPAPVKKWHGWSEFGGYYGTDNASRGEVALFAPLLQGSSTLLFTDLRGKLFEEDAQEGNFALGLRSLHPSGVIFGIWGGYDLRASTHDNVFPQISGGIEALTERFDFRANGYLPLDEDEVIGRSSSNPVSTTTIGLQGTQIISTNQILTSSSIQTELALYGADAEFGARVFHGERSELRLYGGGFWFDNADLPGEVAGPKARVEYRIEDVIPELPGSRLTLEGEVSHDDVRDDKWEIGARLRIPFGGSGAQAQTAYAALTPLERRMTEGLERDTDIVTDTQTETTQTEQITETPVTDDASGEALNVFHVANSAQGAGDCSSPDNACTAATAMGLAGIGDIVVPVDSDGTIAANITLDSARQQAIGGGATGAANIILSDAAGSTLALSGLGGRATVNGTLTLSQANTVAGFDINNAGGTGLLADGNVGMTGNTLSDMTISGSTAGVQFANTSAGMVTFAEDVTINGQAGGAAFDVAGGSASATFSGSINQAQNNFVVSVAGGHSGTLTFQTGTIDATNGSGIALNNADGSYRFTSAVTLTDPGVADTNLTINNSEGVFTFTNLTITGASGNGIALFNSEAITRTDVTITSATITNVGGTGLRIETDGTGSQMVQFENSRIENPGLEGVVSVARNGGVTSLIATNNILALNVASRGFLVHAATGGATTCTRATGNSNGAGGPPSGIFSDAFDFNGQAGGSNGISQTGAAALSGDNNGGVVVVFGTFLTHQVCPIPAN